MSTDILNINDQHYKHDQGAEGLVCRLFRLIAFHIFWKRLFCHKLSVDLYNVHAIQQEYFSYLTLVCLESHDKTQ